MRLTVVTATKGRHDAVIAKAHAMAVAAREAEPYGGLEWRLWVNESPASVERLRDRLRVLDLSFPVHVDGGIDLPVGAARNACVRTARGAIVWLSDDDCRPRPGACAAHLDFHAAVREASDGLPGPRSAELRIGVGPLVLPESLRRGRMREPFERVFALVARLPWIALTGANSSMAKATYLAVGGFDPAWRAYGGDDHDVALRLRAAGATFHRVRGGTAEHHGRTWDDADKAYEAGRSHVRVVRRHPGAGAAWWLGVHPVLARVKRGWYGSSLAHAIDATSARYELAYATGALDAWSGRDAERADAGARRSWREVDRRGHQDDRGKDERR